MKTILTLAVAALLAISASQAFAYQQCRTSCFGGSCTTTCYP